MTNLDNTTVFSSTQSLINLITKRNGTVFAGFFVSLQVKMQKHQQ